MLSEAATVRFTIRVIQRAQRCRALPLHDPQEPRETNLHLLPAGGEIRPVGCRWRKREAVPRKDSPPTSQPRHLPGESRRIRRCWQPFPAEARGVPDSSLSGRVEKVVSYPPLTEFGDLQRREFHEALLEALLTWRRTVSAIAGAASVCNRGPGTGPQFGVAPWRAQPPRRTGSAHPDPEGGVPVKRARVVLQRRFGDAADPVRREVCSAGRWRRSARSRRPRPRTSGNRSRRGSRSPERPIKAGNPLSLGIPVVHQPGLALEGGASSPCRAARVRGTGCGASGAGTSARRARRRGTRSARPARDRASASTSRTARTPRCRVACGRAGARTVLMSETFKGGS